MSDDQHNDPFDSLDAGRRAMRDKKSTSGAAQADLRGAAASADEGSAAAEYERLQADLAEARDRTLRAQAELENYRKRVRREMEDERRYACLPLLQDLLPVLDNIQRAIAAAESSQDAGALMDGVNLVKQQLEAALARHHCVRIDALGKPFDPTYHEAIGQRPSAEHPPYAVLAVAQDGYLLHDRVLRPAQVIVSSPTPE